MRCRLLFLYRIYRIQRKLYWRPRQDASVLNKNGFLLCDALAAVLLSAVFLFPILALTAQSVSLYRQAQRSMAAAAVGRNMMEEIRHQQSMAVPYQQPYEWEGVSYTVTVDIVPVAEEYLRYDVKVQGDDGIHHEFRRLERKETS